MSVSSVTRLEPPWTLAVVGLGYVGLPLAVLGTESGLEVVGYDHHLGKVAQLNRVSSPIEDISDEQLGKALTNGLLVTDRPELLSRADVVVICVPSPLQANHQPDLGPIRQASQTVGKHLRPGQTVILESTTYPGTTEEILLPALTEAGGRLDQDLWVAYSPERISPGTEPDLSQIPKVVGGLSEQSTQRATQAYQQLGMKVHQVSHARVAEMTKLLENTYRAVNIGLINELAQIAHQLDIDIWETVDAAATKPFGFQPFYPGPGVGGHCIPLDPQYLSWRALQVGHQARYIDLTEQVNGDMPQYVGRRVNRLLQQQQVPLEKARVLGVGLAYKPNLGDDRTSPAVTVLRLLAAQSAQVEVLEPHIPPARIKDHGFTPAQLPPPVSYDLALILTDHDQVDYRQVAQSAHRVFDTRGVFRRLGLLSDRVEQL